MSSALWEMLKPDGRPPGFFLAVKVAKLGCETFAEARRKVAQALRLEGKVPAVERPGEVFVREALCPASKDAVQVKRNTAWCHKVGKSCPHMGGKGDGWVKCLALDGDEVEGFDPAYVDVMLEEPEKKPDKQGGYWWDLGSQKQETDQKGQGTLSGLLKILGPAAIGGLAVWHAKEKEIAMLRRPRGTSSDNYKLVRSVLKAYGLTFGYDTDTKTFKLQRGSIQLDSKGGAVLKDRRGKTKRVKRGHVLDSLFEFAASMT